MDIYKNFDIGYIWGVKKEKISKVTVEKDFI